MQDIVVAKKLFDEVVTGLPLWKVQVQEVLFSNKVIIVLSDSCIIESNQTAVVIYERGTIKTFDIRTKQWQKVDLSEPLLIQKLRQHVISLCYVMLWEKIKLIVFLIFGMSLLLVLFSIFVMSLSALELLSSWAKRLSELKNVFLRRRKKRLSYKEECCYGHENKKTR